jgi:hypothetical protein
MRGVPPVCGMCCTTSIDFWLLMVLHGWMGWMGWMGGCGRGEMQAAGDPFHQASRTDTDFVAPPEPANAAAVAVAAAMAVAPAPG